MTDVRHKFHHKLKLFIILFISTLVAALPEAAFAEDDRNVVLAIGHSRIYTDIPAARTAAVDQSLTFAVQSTAVVMIPFAFLTDKFDRIADLLSTRTNEFIADYKVLKEISTDKHYRVLAQVTVSRVKLKDALAEAGLALGPANLPKILLLMAEQSADSSALDYWWRAQKSFFRIDAAASAMKIIFAGKEFPLIDEDMIPPEMVADLKLGAALTDEQAIDLGRRVQADVVIVGDAVARETQNRMGEFTRTFQGTVNARGILVETGEQIARTVNAKTSVGQDAETGSRQSLTVAGEQAAIAMIGQILSRWQDLLKEKEQITLYIQGTDILPYLVLFRNALTTVEGLSRQQTIEMTPDAAVLTVRFDGGTSLNLADALLLKSFDTFGINIYDISATALRIQLFAK